MKFRILTISTVLIISTAIMLSYSMASDPCGPFAFPNQGDQLLSFVSKSLAKVYGDEKGINYLGTAVVIDVDQGYLLTARHVVQDEFVYIKFPFLKNMEIYKAKIHEEISPAEGKNQDLGEDWDVARDIAILELDKPQLHSVAIEIWFDSINLNKKYHFFSFSEDSTTPIQGNLTASVPKMHDTGKGAKCLLESREITLHGDSGSPVVDETGLLVGILIQQRNNNLTSRFVPAECFSSTLIGAFEGTISKNIISFIQKEPIGIIESILQPSPKSDEWITNLRFASAIERAAKNKDDANRIADKHNCPIRYAILERGLGFDLYDRYHAKIYTAMEMKEEADEFQKRGQSLETDRHSNAVLALYNAAENRYQMSIAKIIERPGGQKNIDSLSNQNLLLIAQSYKGLSDLQTKRGILTDNKELFLAAQSNAAAAALISPNESLKGSSLAALGVAAQYAGNQEFAIKAYSTAVTHGFSEPWVIDNYKYAFKIRDNTRSEFLAKDYKPAGKYEPIGKMELKSALINPGDMNLFK